MSRKTIAHTCSNPSCGKTFKRRVRDTDRGGRFVSCPHCGTYQNGPRVAEEKASELDERKRQQRERDKRRRPRARAAAPPKEEKPAEDQVVDEDPPPTKIEERPEKRKEERKADPDQERHAGLFW